MFGLVVYGSEPLRASGPARVCFVPFFMQGISRLTPLNDRATVWFYSVSPFLRGSFETTTRKFGFIRLIAITTLHAIKDGVFTRFFRKFNTLFMVVS